MAKKIKGLTSDEVLISREKHGANSHVKAKTKGLFRRFLENLGDPIIKILLAALALEVIFTLGNCNLFEIGGIVSAILIATVVSTLSEYRSERAFSALESGHKYTAVRVLRDGEIGAIDSSELVVGDIVYISSGERIYADGSLVDGELAVDQSALNGENVEARKHVHPGGDFDLSNSGKVFSGSVVTDGEGIMRVERVGGETFFGMVARDVQSETRVSPLKLRLSKLASQISKLGYMVAFFVGFMYLFNSFVTDNNFQWDRIVASFSDLKFLFSTFIHALTLMITVVVVAVPEGLPMMITVVLSANMKKMLKDNVLVKKLVGIETAGSLNILFTDKTGTLTTGKLSVDRIITECDVIKNIPSLKGTGEIYRQLALCAYYNTECTIGKDGVIGGNATDRAIAEFFMGQRRESRDVVDKKRFSSDTKFSSVTFTDGTAIIKGAAEVLLSRCRFALDGSGRALSSDLHFAKKQYNDALSRGERVIAIALSDGSEYLTFIALVVIKDRIRTGVRQAVSEIIGAGIQIVMLTGDNKDTAISIAEECGFFKRGAGHIALSGDELRAMSDGEVKAVLPMLRIVARALPRDKSRLVALSQERGLVVGMTGDGINDAPSLKLADVGFAMGSGTEIAKSAADIVILDNSISAIAKTILYGRTIFKSIRKFITFQLIMNFAACGITLIGPFLGVETPITIIQMLWVNIIMDTLGGLAFAGEAPHSYYMKEKPIKREEPILSKNIMWQILLNGAFTLLLLVAFLRLDMIADIYSSGSHFLGAFYALFIFAGLFNCFTSRCERFWIFSGISKNKTFIFIMTFISVIQLLIIYFGGELFRSAPLSLNEILLVVLLASSVLVFDLIRRIGAKLK